MKDSDQINILTKAQLAELRKLILGLDEEDLKRLADLVNDPDSFAEYIVGYLPLSIKKLIESKRVTLEDVIPFIEQAIHESIKRDPQGLADILYPVMGPAIRKAVSEDIKRMLESVNNVVEHSFSVKRLGWRLQALFTGKSYAEIVLSHAFVYRVKQVFLIHRETGLLLYDLADTTKGVAHDADMVSSMLTAIKDFVSDSLNVDNQQEQLDTIQVGDYTIWIEQGPYAILAAIIEGRAPEDLKLVMKEALEGIHVNFINELENFSGDTEIFQKTERFLASCLQKQEKEKKHKKPVGLIVITLFLLIFGGWYAYHCIDNRTRFFRFVADLNEKPGVYVVKAEPHFLTKNLVEGLRDPMAVDPMETARKFDLDSTVLALQFRPYISLDDDLVLMRVRKKLGLSEQFNMKYHQGVLYVNQKVDSVLYQKFLKLPNTMVGITGVKFKTVSALPPKEVVKKDIFDIQKIFFVFKFNEVKLDSAQKIKFKKLIDKINRVYDFNFDQDSVPVIVVRAMTGMEGNPEANKTVAFDRAKQFIDLMVQAGIPVETLVPQIIIKEHSSEPYPLRSVSFKVKYVKPEEL